MNTDSPQPELPVLLIAEDDGDLLRILEKVFRSHYAVHTAQNGKQAFEKAKEIIPDIVVSDILMPEMDGLQFCRLLKDDTSTGHIPFVMLTAKSTPQNQIEGLMFGADYYVTKPFNSDFLVQCVDGLVQSRKALRERFKEEYSVLNDLESIKGLERAFVENAVECVKKNIADPHFQTGDMARALGMSIRSLQRKFKEATDSSPAKFILEVKARYASELLLNSTLNVTQVGLEVGIENSSSFARVFKQHFGLTPSEYRAEELHDV